MYAIVRCGGRQEKVALDDVLTVDKLPDQAGSSVTLPALLVVDGDRVISDPIELGRFQVTAEVVGDAAGPKINMIHYRNKTGYKRRLGHRQRYTQVRITGISGSEAGGKSRSAAAKTDAAKTDRTRTGGTRTDGTKADSTKADSTKAKAATRASAGSKASKAQATAGEED